MFTPSTTPLPHMQNLSKSNTKYEKLRLNWVSVPHLILLGFGLVSVLWLMLLHSCNQVEYITFNTNLNLFKKKSNFIFPKIWFYLSLVLLWLFLYECPVDFLILLFLHYCPHFALTTSDPMFLNAWLVVVFILHAYSFSPTPSHLRLIYYLFLFFKSGAMHNVIVFHDGYLSYLYFWPMILNSTQAHLTKNNFLIL